MNIPLGKPFLGDEEREAVEKVIRSGRLATGDTVKELERALARKFQRKYCIAVSSGTAALYLGLKASGIECVVIPALTCDSVLNAVLNAGTRVIFADVEPETHNLDLSSLSERQLSDAEAVIVTHTYGHSANMDELDHYLKKYNLVLVEDFAQATGGYFRDRILGSFGKVATTSFYAPKVMATGHGGAMFTDDEEIYLRCMQGRGTQLADHYKGLIPMNFQMTDVQAAIGLVQLNKLDAMVELRHNRAIKYTQQLESSPVALIGKKTWAKHAYYKYAIMLPESIQKQAFIKKMSGLGIETGKLYAPPLHKTKIAAELVSNRVKLSVAEHLAPRVVSLPMFPELTGEDIEKVCGAIRSVINDLGGEIQSTKHSAKCAA